MTRLAITALAASLLCAPAYASDKFHQMESARMYCDEHKHYETNFNISYDAPFFSQNCPQLEVLLKNYEDQEAARDEAERLPVEQKAVLDALRSLISGDR